MHARHAHSENLSNTKGERESARQGKQAGAQEDSAYVHVARTHGEVGNQEMNAWKALHIPGQALHSARTRTASRAPTARRPPTHML